LKTTAEHSKRGRAIDQAAHTLPEGWVIVLQIELGYAGILLEDPNGEHIETEDYTSHDSHLSEQIRDAIAHAIASNDEYEEPREDEEGFQ
jgi:hypothetical protein